MLPFRGTDQCLVDANGRIKLPPQVIRDLTAAGKSGDLVLEFLPEGCLALYPEETYLKIREKTDRDEDPGRTFLDRAMRRQSAGWCSSLRLTNQGRAVLPSELAAKAGIGAGQKVKLVGIRIGIEIWNTASYEEEQTRAVEYARRKRDQEMEQALTGQNG